MGKAGFNLKIPIVQGVPTGALQSLPRFPKQVLKRVQNALCL